MGERSIAVHDERTAVEHQFILASDLVHVGDRQSRFDDALAREIEPHMKLLNVEGRTVRRQQELGAGACQVSRARRRPDVLADGEAEAHIAEDHRIRQRSRRKDPFLVEHPVVWQLVLEAQLRATVGHERHRIVDNAVGGPGESDDEAGHAVCALAFQLAQYRSCRLHERRPQHQILGRVSHQHQLGKDHEVGTECGGVTAGAPHERGVAWDVADSGIQLCERDGEHPTLRIPDVRRCDTIRFSSGREDRA